MPCGNIDPYGITGTPVIDTTSGVLYTAALQASPAVHHELYALNLSAGGVVLYHYPIDGPGADPLVHGQRAALTLANGRVYVPYSGRAGDCGDYTGRVVSVATGDTTGGSLQGYVLPSTARGGIWAAASADSVGNVYIATGNSLAIGTAPDHGESVVKLSPTLKELDFFTAPEWSDLNANDADIGSIGPILLQNGWILQSGKNGMGYLLNSASLGHVGGQLFEGRICDPGQQAIAFGAYLAPGTVFIPCTSALKAVHVTTTGSAPGFTVTTVRSGYSGDQGTSPPIIAGGIVWNLDAGHGLLLGFNASTGVQQFSQSLAGTPAHFAAPSSGAGHVFVPSGSILEGFTLSGGPTPPPAGGQLQLLSQPQRLIDTRMQGGLIATGSSRCFAFAGLNAIPSDAVGLVLNITAVGYATRGWLTVFPDGQPVPTTSTLNFDPAAYAIANGVITRLGSGGRFCVNVGTVNSALGASHVIVDATGYLSGSATPELPLLTQPQRLVDTRTSSGPIDSGATRCFAIAGQAGVPADAVAAVLNVSAVAYTAPGWLTLFPSGQPMPPTSTLNLDPAAYAIANETIARIGSSGQVCVNIGTVNSAPGASQVILDVVGYQPGAGATHMPVLAAPQRLVDTRASGAPIAMGTSRCFTLSGRAGIPSAAVGVVLNVTGVGYARPGWLTLFPTGQPLPATSTLNVDPSAYAIANGTIARLGSGGQVCVNVGTINAAPGSSHVVLDATAYLLQ